MSGANTLQILTVNLHIEPFADGGWYTVRRDAQISAHVGSLHLIQDEPFALDEFYDCGKWRKRRGGRDKNRRKREHRKKRFKIDSKLR